MEGVRLPSCPLTATVLPQYQRQTLQWWEYPAEDFSLVLFNMTNAEDLGLSCLLLAPKCTLGEGTLLLFHTSLLLSSFVSFGAQLLSNGVHRAQCFLCLLPSAGASYPVQSLATSEIVSLRPGLLKSPQKCSLFSMGHRLCCPPKGGDKAMEVTFVGKPLHLLSDTESQLWLSQEPSLIQVIVFVFQL